MRIISETIEANATATLKAENPKSWRARYTASNLSGAVRSAARYARANNVETFVIAGNSYGCFCYHVSVNLADVTNIINNSGKRAYRVTPDATVSKIVCDF